MTLPPPASRRRRQAEATHGQLLDAARDVFTEVGFLAATVAAVTERAATAHGTFYLHFRNIDDAFGQVVSGVIDELFEDSDAAWDAEPASGTARAVRSFLVVFEQHRGLWRALLEAMLTRPEIERLWVRLRRRFVDRIARNIAAAQAAGQVRPMDAVLAANAMASMVEWYAFTHLVLADPPGTRPGCTPDQFDLEASVAVLTDLWVHAVFTPAAAAPTAGGDLR